MKSPSLAPPHAQFPKMLHRFRRWFVPAFGKWIPGLSLKLGSSSSPAPCQPIAHPSITNPNPFPRAPLRPRKAQQSHHLQTICFGPAASSRLLNCGITPLAAATGLPGCFIALLLRTAELSHRAHFSRLGEMDALAPASVF